MNGRQSSEGWFTVWPTGSASVRCMSFVCSIEIPDTVGVDDVASLCHVFRRGYSHLEFRAAIVAGVAAVLAVQALYGPSAGFVRSNCCDAMLAADDEVTHLRNGSGEVLDALAF